MADDKVRDGYDDGIQHGIDDDHQNDPQKGAVIGGLGGAAVGAAAGSMLGPIGAVIGGAVGAVAGAAASAGAVAAIDNVDNDNNMTGMGSDVDEEDETDAGFRDTTAPGYGTTTGGAIAGSPGYAGYTPAGSLDNNTTRPIGYTGGDSAATAYDRPSSMQDTLDDDEDTLPGNNIPGVQTGGYATGGTPDTRGMTEKAADAVTGDHLDDKTGRPV